MLIKFSIENYKSICDKLELDFSVKVNDSNKKEIEKKVMALLELVDIKEKLTPEEQAELDAEEDFINNLV